VFCFISNQTKEKRELALAKRPRISIMRLTETEQSIIKRITHNESSSGLERKNTSSPSFENSLKEGEIKC